MNTAYLMDRKSNPSAVEPTTDFPQPSVSSERRKPRCKIAMPGGSGGQPHDIGCVLRYRLLIASVILGAGFTIFFVRGLFSGENFFGFQQWDLVVQGVAAAIVVMIATLLGTYQQISVRRLRIMELVLFGTAAAYFAWLQVICFSDARILDWAKEEHAEAFLRVANAGNVLRWFALIVIYGTFVPNTWKRAAIFVGILAAIPLLLMTLTCTACSEMQQHDGTQALIDMIVLLGVASSIAIFGSYKISELQQEALEARKLGQYQLKELLGSGGMGEVYLGEHMMLRRACAIKLIKPDQSGDYTSVSRFEREVKSMATLTHWNTVEVYDYGLSEDGTFYYVMEYLPGMSLQDLVEQYGPLSPERTVHFLRQICDALQEAHSIGLIHRDIKPSNVIAAERGGIYDVAKLLDFGLVQSVGLNRHDARLTVQGVVLGSPPYMSPEQAMGKDKLDGRTDIYSVGGLAYFLLTGRPAFERDTPMQILMAHVYDEVKSLAEQRPDVPGDLEAIVMKCLNKDPKDRFQDAESLEQALAQCECANDWGRRDAAEWWRMHERGRKETPVAVA